MLNPYLPITAISLQRPLSSVPKLVFWRGLTIDFSKSGTARILLQRNTVTVTLNSTYLIASGNWALVTRKVEMSCPWRILISSFILGYIIGSPMTKEMIRKMIHEKGLQYVAFNAISPIHESRKWWLSQLEQHLKMISTRKVSKDKTACKEMSRKSEQNC